MTTPSNEEIIRAIFGDDPSPMQWHVEAAERVRSLFEGKEFSAGEDCTSEANDQPSYGRLASATQMERLFKASSEYAESTSCSITVHLSTDDTVTLKDDVDGLDSMEIIFDDGKEKKTFFIPQENIRIFHRAVDEWVKRFSILRGER